MGNSRRVHYAGAFAALVFLTQPASAKSEQPPEPANHPDWAEASQQAVDQIVSELRDPDSARIRWTSGFQWGFVRGGLFGKRRYGWIACGIFNGKNGFGGYAGEERFYVAVTQWGTVETGFPDRSVVTSTCDQGPTAPKQRELIDVDPSMIHSPPPMRASVADEIRKLAKLRDDGLITAAEFDAGKAKLLGN